MEKLFHKKGKVRKPSKGIVPDTATIKSVNLIGTDTRHGRRELIADGIERMLKGKRDVLVITFNGGEVVSMKPTQPLTSRSKTIEIALNIFTG